MVKARPTSPPITVKQEKSSGSHGAGPSLSQNGSTSARSQRPTSTASRPVPSRQYWWVVLKGTEPGVYTSHTAAREAAGTHRLVQVERMGSEEKAQLLWSTALGAGHITLLPAAG
ncbi:hypothetical protein VNI00_010327 [Paramarasmius palmivorus]|uniref:Uncharacterized protein n=1 Tax=Paramarasmius palmivorus TaxID=297713 RepID=A0AAW0CM87_9AGAR